MSGTIILRLIEKDIKLFFGNRAAQRLVAICQQLALEHGGPFFLSCRIAGKLVGVHATTAMRTIRFLLDRGVLRLITPGRPGRAAVYLYTHANPPE